MPIGAQFCHKLPSWTDFLRQILPAAFLMVALFLPLAPISSRASDSEEKQIPMTCSDIVVVSPGVQAILELMELWLEKQSNEKQIATLIQNIHSRWNPFSGHLVFDVQSAEVAEIYIRDFKDSDWESLQHHSRRLIQMFGKGYTERVLVDNQTARNFGINQLNLIANVPFDSPPTIFKTPNGEHYMLVSRPMEPGSNERVAELYKYFPEKGDIQLVSQIDTSVLVGKSSFARKALVSRKPPSRVIVVDDERVLVTFYDDRGFLSLNLQSASIEYRVEPVPTKVSIWGDSDNKFKGFSNFIVVSPEEIYFSTVTAQKDNAIKDLILHGINSLTGQVENYDVRDINAKDVSTQLYQEVTGEIYWIVASEDKNIELSVFDLGLKEFTAKIKHTSQQLVSAEGFVRIQNGHWILVNNGWGIKNSSLSFDPASKTFKELLTHEMHSVDSKGSVYFQSPKRHSYRLVTGKIHSSDTIKQMVIFRVDKNGDTTEKVAQIEMESSLAQPPEIVIDDSGRIMIFYKTTKNELGVLEFLELENALLSIDKYKFDLKTFQWGSSDTSVFVRDTKQIQIFGITPEQDLKILSVF